MNVVTSTPLYIFNFILTLAEGLWDYRRTVKVVVIFLSSLFLGYVVITMFRACVMSAMASLSYKCKLPDPFWICFCWDILGEFLRKEVNPSWRGLGFWLLCCYDVVMRTFDLLLARLSTPDSTLVFLISRVWVWAEIYETISIYKTKILIWYYF